MYRPSREQLETINRMITFSRKLQEADFSVQLLKVFLLIAREGAVPMPKLGELSGEYQATISRYLGQLGQYGKGRKKPMYLVESFENPQNRKQKSTTLTTKGEAFLRELIEILETDK